MKKHIGILGSGVVGITLANGLKSAGYDVSVANRQGKVSESWNGDIGTYQEVAAKSDVLILAVKGLAAETVINTVKDKLESKTVIDTTNPIADSPSDEGVIKYFTSLDESLMERLQQIAPKANFVKSFNSVGNAYMVNPNFNGVKPVMFICGNDKGAKDDATEILDQLGWGSEDFGGVKSARVIEPLCALWCLPGFLHNKWSHAFTILKG